MENEATVNIRRLPGGSIDYRYYTLRGAQARSIQISSFSRSAGNKILNLVKIIPVFLAATFYELMHHSSGG